MPPAFSLGLLLNDASHLKFSSVIHVNQCAASIERRLQGFKLKIFCIARIRSVSLSYDASGL